MAFLEELKYDLWEFGWGNFLGCLMVIIPITVCCFGWKNWKNSYSERRNTYGERLKIQVNAQLQHIEPRIFIYSGYTGTKARVLGYDLTYTYSCYGKKYEGKDQLPKNSEFPINQMIKQLRDTTYHPYIPIRVDKENPAISQVVIQPLVYY